MRWKFLMDRSSVARCTRRTCHDFFVRPDHHRIAIVREADKFVSSNRSSLERWIASPPADAVLILEVTSFPGTTNLYKQAVAKGLVIQCSPPTTSAWGNPVDEKAVAKWIDSWAKKKLRTCSER